MVLESFSNSPRRNDIGLVTGLAVETNFPDNACVMLRFKADPDNLVDMGLGTESGELFWQLAPGDDTGWIPAHNLNQFYYEGTGSYLTYWLMG